MDIEDDLFFADLNKQISLLIMDDDDPLVHTPSVSLQAFSRAIYPATQPPIFYHQTCTRESKGTGVFIPQSSSHQRRRNRQAKYNSSTNSKYHNQLNENSRGIMINNPQGSNYMNVPPHHSFNAKKHVEDIGNQQYLRRSLS